jgi:hypothetical protein
MLVGPGHPIFTGRFPAAGGGGFGGGDFGGGGGSWYGAGGFGGGRDTFPMGLPRGSVPPGARFMVLLLVVSFRPSASGGGHVFDVQAYGVTGVNDQVAVNAGTAALEYFPLYTCDKVSDAAFPALFARVEAAAAGFAMEVQAGLMLQPLQRMRPTEGSRAFRYEGTEGRPFVIKTLFRPDGAGDRTVSAVAVAMYQHILNAEVVLRSSVAASAAAAIGAVQRSLPPVPAQLSSRAQHQRRRCGRGGRWDNVFPPHLPCGKMGRTRTRHAIETLPIFTKCKWGGGSPKG